MSNIFNDIIIKSDCTLKKDNNNNNNDDDHDDDNDKINITFDIKKLFNFTTKTTTEKNKLSDFEIIDFID